MLAYLSWLINCGYVKEIEYVLLPPGHSHYCMDRDCFIVVGKLKRLKNCFTEFAFWNTFVPVGFNFQNINRPIRLKLDGYMIGYRFLSLILIHIRGRVKFECFDLRCKKLMVIKPQ